MSGNLPPPPPVEVQLSTRKVTAEQAARVADLADRIFGHMLRVVDLDRLYQIEQCLWSELDRLDMDDESGDLATALLAEALHRVGYRPERHANMIPDGISDDEVIAAEYDDDCLMCRNDAADMEHRLSGQRCGDQRAVEDKDLRNFMEGAAKAWRVQHAAALRRFGLA